MLYIVIIKIIIIIVIIIILILHITTVLQILRSIRLANQFFVFWAPEKGLSNPPAHYKFVVLYRSRYLATPVSLCIVYSCCCYWFVGVLFGFLEFSVFKRLYKRYIC